MQPLWYGPAPVAGLRHLQRQRAAALLAAAALALTVFVAQGFAGGPSVSTLRARDAAIAAKSRSAVLSLYSLDSRLAAATARLTVLRAEQRTIGAQQALLKRERITAALDVKLSRTRLAARVRQLYENPGTSGIEIFLGAQNLDSALTQLDELNKVASINTDVIRSVEAAQVRLGVLSRKLKVESAHLTETTRSAVVTASRLQAARDELAGYIGHLAHVRRLTQASIAADQAVALAATRKATQLSGGVLSATTATVVSGQASAPLFAGERTLTVSATGYSLPGHTSSGIPVGYGVAAVDPRVIPLGTHMTIPGYGEAIAADTGSAVIGADIDLWFPTLAAAQAWGRRTITIALH